MSLKGRTVHCPLCFTPENPRYLAPGGICYACSDARRDVKREYGKAAVERDHARIDVIIKQQQRVEAGRRALIAEEKAAKKDKERKTQVKQLSNIQKEQASLSLARKSVLHYIERRKPDYKINWFIEDVARRIEKFYDDVINERSPRLILTVPSRAGKNCSNSTPILTSNRGWTTHGDLQVGDHVFGLDGRPTKVVGVSPEWECNMEIEFSDGTIIGTHESHEWQVARRSNKKFRVLSTKDIYHNKFGHVRSLVSSGRPTYKIPGTPPLQGEDLDLPMHPYVLSSWLGDGCTTSPRITHHPNEMKVVDTIESLGYEKTKSVHYFSAGSCNTHFSGVRGSRSSSRMLRELHELNLINNKHIPDIYLRASEQQRLELLAGFIDTDGHVDKTSRVVFTNTNKRLIDGFEFLARSLGQKPYVWFVEPRLSSSGVQGRQRVYKCGFQATRTDFPMRIPRKKILRAVQKQSIFITRIEYKPGLEPGKCIQVAAPDGMYLVGKNLIPTHNSELASDSGPAWFLGNNPDKTVVIASYSDDLPTKFSKSIRAQLQSPDYKKIFPRGARVSKTDSAAGAWMTEQGGGLKAVGCGGGLLGFGAHAMIMDDIIRSAEDADNPATLESAYDWMTSTALSRLFPGGGMMLIMQRLAPLDPVGRVHLSQKEEEKQLQDMLEEIAEHNDRTAAGITELENLEREAKELDDSMDRWETIIYPALATYHEYLTPMGDIVRTVDDREVQPDWRQLRKPGDALHPERYSRNALLKLQRANPHRFQSMYMLDPIAEAGEYFLATDFNRYVPGKHPKLETLHKFCAWDLAISTKTHADYTVGVAGGIDYEGRIWLFEMIRGRFGDLGLISDLIIDLHLRWDVSMTGIEKTAMELSLASPLRAKMQERKEFIALAEGKSALRPIADKRMRARTLQASAKQGKVFIPNGELWDSFVAEASTFPIGGHDDMVDAVSWLAIMLTKEGLPRDPKKVMEANAQNRPEGYDPYADEFDKLAQLAEGVTYMSS